MGAAPPSLLQTPLKRWPLGKLALEHFCWDLKVFLIIFVLSVWGDWSHSCGPKAPEWIKYRNQAHSCELVWTQIAMSTLRRGNDQRCSMLNYVPLKHMFPMMLKSTLSRRWSFFCGWSLQRIFKFKWSHWYWPKGVRGVLGHGDKHKGRQSKDNRREDYQVLGMTLLHTRFTKHPVLQRTVRSQCRWDAD